jgi:predicted permease
MPHTNMTGPTRWFERMRQDARVAIRSLRRTPGYTVAATAILALGIGMSAAMFTIYRVALVERLPVADQDRLIVMHPLDRGGAHLDAPYPYLKVIAKDTSLFRGVAGVYHLGALPNPYLDGDATITLNQAYVSPNLFELLGVRPYLGRVLRTSDGEVGAREVIVLSYATWRRVFHADPRVVGRVMYAPGPHTPTTIVGVAPPGLEYPAGTESWMQLKSDFTAQVDIVARLRGGATIDAARAQLFNLTQRVGVFAGEQLPDQPKISGVEAHAFAHEVLGNARPVIVLLTIAVGLLLLIACVNVGNLVLVRGIARAREVAVRRAIGASFGDIVHQFVIENALLGLLGGAMGFIVALILVRVLLAHAPAELPRTDALSLSGMPITSAIGATMLALVLFGLAPSVMAARAAPYRALRSDARSGGGPRTTRRTLVAAQMALALVMLAGATLLARSLNRLLSVNLGFAPEHVALLDFTGPQSVFSSSEKNAQIADELVSRLAAVPGVTSTTVIESEPFVGESFYIMKIGPAEQSVAERRNDAFVPFEAASPEYFRTLGISIVRGRAFLPTDNRQSQRVIILSESLARRFWPNQDAIGKQIRNAYDTTNTVWTVVGVAQDTHFRTLGKTSPAVYEPFDQFDPPWWTGHIAARTASSMGRMLPALRAAAAGVRPGIIIWNARSLDGFLDRPLAQPRLSALLMSAFSVVALLLAAIGLYAVMSAFVRQQTRDIGVRIALGATGRDVRRLVLREALGVVGAGGGLGLLAAIVATRFLSSQLYDVRPTDPLSLGGSCLALALVAAATAYFPAYRASTIDPVLSLRAE